MEERDPPGIHLTVSGSVNVSGKSRVASAENVQGATESESEPQQVDEPRAKDQLLLSDEKGRTRDLDEMPTFKDQVRSSGPERSQPPTPATGKNVHFKDQVREVHTRPSPAAGVHVYFNDQVLQEVVPSPGEELALVRSCQWLFSFLCLNGFTLTTFCQLRERKTDKFTSGL